MQGCGAEGGERLAQLVNPQKESKKFEIMSLFRIFLEIYDKKKFEISPSVFKRECLLSSKERHQKTIHYFRKKKMKDWFYTPPKGIVLSPPIVIFQNWKPRSTYINSLSITCIYEKTHIYIKDKICDVFEIDDSKVHNPFDCRKQFDVLFTPINAMDYFYMLEFFSSEGVIKVPLVAIGPRPILDFPDVIELPDIPVKKNYYQSLLVRNSGWLTGSVVLEIEWPYRVEPSKIFLTENLMTELKIYFQSSCVDTYKKKLKVHYDSGETVVIPVTGRTVDCDVILTPLTIKLSDTYINLSGTSETYLTNNSKYILKYEWKLNVEEESVEENTECEQFFPLKDSNDDDEDTDVGNGWNSGRHFIIHPKKGEIWPSTTVTFTILFRPTDYKDYYIESVLNMEGLNKNLNLKVYSKVLGPNIFLNVDLLEIDTIFPGVTYTYEILVHNRSLMEGHVEFLEDNHSNTVYGAKFDCDPPFLELGSNETKGVTLSVFNDNPGDFIGEYKFRVIETNKMLKLLVKGTIATPLVVFKPQELDFGTVALGFPVVKFVFVRNASPCQVKFQIKQFKDGTRKHNPCWEYNAQEISMVSYDDCQQVRVHPLDGVMFPYTDQRIRIELIPSRVGYFAIKLEGYIWDIFQETMVLDIYFNGMAPEVECLTPELNETMALITVPFEKAAIFKNYSCYSSYFYATLKEDPDNQIDDSNFYFCSASMKGVLQAESLRGIPVCFRVDKRGKFRFILLVYFFGLVTPYEVHMRINVHGPVLDVSTPLLNWGSIEVLKPVGKTFSLINTTPVRSFFSVSVKNHPQLWEICDTLGTVPPRSTTEVEVIAYLIDPGPVKDTLVITVKHNSSPLLIVLEADGYGCSFVTQPPLWPNYDLGHIYRNYMWEFPISLHNFGSRNAYMIWTTDMNVHVSKCFRQGKYFTFSLNKFHIKAGKSITLKLNAFSETPIEVEEEFHCYAVFNQRGKREHVQYFTISATFVELLIDVSPKVIDFSVLASPDDQFPPESRRSVTMVSKCQYDESGTVELTGDGFQLIANSTPVEGKLEVDLRVEVILSVLFVPNVKDETCPENYDAFIVIVHSNNRLKTVIPIKGIVIYPKLEFDTHEIHFDVIRPCAQDTKVLKISNKTPMNVSYTWFFMNPTFEEDSNTSTQSNSPRSDEFLMKFQEYKEDLGSTFAEFFLPLLSKYKLKENIYEYSKLMEHIDGDRFKHCQFLDCSPREGKLGPNETVCMKLVFKPDREMSFKAVAVCDIRGGLKEFFVLTGNCERVYYEVWPKKIDVGFVPYCKESETSVTLKSKCHHITLPYTIDILTRNIGIASENQENTRESEPQIQKTLRVLPSKGTLKPLTSLMFEVTFLPAFLGEFVEIFSINIGEEKPVVIQIFGYAVPYQLHVNLPMRDLIPDITYASIGSLFSRFFSHLHKSEDSSSSEGLERSSVVTTAEDLGAIQEDMGPLILHHKCRRRSSIGSVYSDSIDEFMLSEEIEQYLATPSPSSLKVTSSESLKEYLLDEEYEIICPNKDIYPSVPEIDLAIERIFMSEAIKQLSVSSSKRNTIKLEERLHKKMYSPGYILDFGTIIIDKDVEYIIELNNCGWFDLKITTRLPERGNALKKKGLYIFAPEKKSIKMGSSFSFKVMLKPDSRRYPGVQYSIKCDFIIDVECGPVIPIHILANFSIPHLKVRKVINFKERKCGLKEIRYVKLINGGTLDCEFKMYLEEVHVQIITPRKGIFSFTKNPFQVTKALQKIPSQNSLNIAVVFEPEEEGTFERFLIIDVMDNKNPYKILLKGKAVEPKIVISNTRLDFGYILPNISATLEFTVTNNTRHELEVYLPLYSSLPQEERIKKSHLLRYYMSNIVYVPEKYHGKNYAETLNNSYALLQAVAYRTYLLHLQKGDMSSCSESLAHQSNSKKGKEKIKKLKAPDESMRAVSSVKTSSENVLKWKTADETQQNRKKTRETFKKVRTNNDTLGLKISHTKSREKFKKLKSKFKSRSLNYLALASEKTAVFLGKVTFENENSSAALLDAAEQREVLRKFRSSVKLRGIGAVRRTSHISNISLKSTRMSIDPEIDEALLSKNNPVVLEMFLDWLDAEPDMPRPCLFSDLIQVAMKPLIIVTGAPYTGYKYYANKLGTRSNIQVTDLDHIIVNELINSERIVALEINSILDQSFESLPRVKLKEKGDPFLILLEKINLLKAERKSKWINRGQQGPPSSLLNLNQKEDMTYLNIPVSYLDRLIRPKFMELIKTEGLIIEGLESSFFIESCDTLVFILNMSWSFDNVHFVNFLQTIGQYLKHISIENLRSATELEKQEETKYQKRIDDIEGMSGLDFKQLPAKEKLNYRKDLMKRYSKFPELDYMNIDERSMYLSSLRKTKKKRRGSSKSLKKFELPHSYEKEFKHYLDDIFHMRQMIDEVDQIKTSRDTQMWTLFCHDSVVDFEGHVDSLVNLLFPKQEQATLPEAELFLCLKQSHIEDMFLDSDYFTVENNYNRYIEELTGITTRGEDPEYSRSYRETIQATKEDFLVKDYIDDLITHVILEPGRSMTWQVVFKSPTLGVFEHEVEIKIIDIWKSRYTIHCNARTEIPEICVLPSVLFPKVCSEASHMFYEPTYLIPRNKLCFGPIFVSNKTNRGIFNLRCPLNIQNVSYLDLQLLSSFMVEDATFGLEPDIVDIKAQGHATLNIWACPTTEGVHNNTVILSVKDSPQPFQFRVGCVGVNASVTIIPSSLVVYDVLLYREKKRTLTIRNTCELPLRWKVAEGESYLTGDVTLTKTSGELMKGFQESIVIKYRPTFAITTTRIIKIQFFDQWERGPVLTKKITLTLSGKDVILELYFEEGTTYLNFGTVRMDSSVEKMFLLKNVGDYNVWVRLTPVPVLKVGKVFDRMLSFYPEKCLLKMNKVFSVNVMLTSLVEMDLTNEKIIKVDLINPNDKIDTIATFYVNASVNTAYAEIRINPSPELNFGEVLVEDSKKMSFFIENLSPFELKFLITNGVPYKDILALRKFKAKESALKEEDMVNVLRKIEEYGMEIVETLVAKEILSPVSFRRRRRKFRSGRKVLKKPRRGSKLKKSPSFGSQISTRSKKKMSWRSLTAKKPMKPFKKKITSPKTRGKREILKKRRLEKSNSALGKEQKKRAITKKHAGKKRRKIKKKKTILEKEISIRGVLRKIKKGTEGEEDEDIETTKTAKSQDDIPEDMTKDDISVIKSEDKVSDTKIKREISESKIKLVTSDAEPVYKMSEPNTDDEINERKIKFVSADTEPTDELSEHKIKDNISERKSTGRTMKKLSKRKSKKNINKKVNRDVIVAFLSPVRRDSNGPSKDRKESLKSSSEEAKSISYSASISSSPWTQDSRAAFSNIRSDTSSTLTNPYTTHHNKKKFYSEMQSPSELIGHDIPLSNILSIGDFVVYPKSTIIMPYESAEINVLFLAETEKIEEQHIAFSIPGVKDNEQGIVQYLIAATCMPNIDIFNVDSLFRDIIKIEKSNESETVMGHQFVTYNTDKERVNFHNVILWCTETLNVYVENKSHKKGYISAYLNKIPQKTFLLQPSGTVVMEPYSTNILKLIFCPGSVGTFYCRLRLRAHLPNGENPTNDIQVEGKCVVPLIRIICPPPSSSDKCVIDFGSVPIEDTLIQTFTLKNTGQVDAKVSVNLSIILEGEDAAGVMSRAKSRDADSFIVSTNQNERIRYCTPITLLIGESVELSVSFTPQRPKHHTAEIRLHVPYNPFEMANVHLRGRGYRDLFAIKGLPLVKTKALLVESELGMYFTDAEKAKKYWSVYRLNFGVCRINSIETREFVLFNKHKTVIRFEWPIDPYIVIVPRIGHINPGSSKKIKASFRAAADHSVNKISFNCTCFPIEYLDKDAKKEEWDLENKQVYWPEDDTGIAVRKCEVKEIEPLHIGWQEKLFVISLMTSGVSCYPVVSVFPKQLDFVKLFSFQAEEKQIELKNRGIIDVAFQWEVVLASQIEIRPEVVPHVVVTSLDSIQWKSFINLRETTLEEDKVHGTGEDPHRKKERSEAPFDIHVEPPAGTINEGQSMNFTVSVVIQGPYSLSANIILKTEADVVQDEATVIVNGTSVLPCCYLIAERLFNLPSGLLDEEKFKHVDSPKSNNLIHTELRPMTGTIRGGTYEEISIFILIEEYGFSLFQWSLTIKEWEIEQFFLVKVKADRPHISIEPTIITMDPIAIGSTTYRTIVITNNEMQNFNFYFEELTNNNPVNSLKIHPQKGILSPNSKEKMKIEFTGHEENESVITVNCHIESVPDPLTVTVHTKCFPSLITVFFESYGLEKIEMNPQSTNVVNLGETICKVPSCKIEFHFLITNKSEVSSYYYEWNYNDVEISKFFSIDWPNRKGILNPERTEIIPVTVQPLDVCKKVILNVTLKVRTGHEYKIQLKMASVESHIYFEISEYDFHTCLVQKSNKVYNETKFKCFNNSNKPALVEKCFFDTEYLKVVPSAFILEAFSEKNIRIYFLPREEIDYNEKVEFMINGIISKVISVHGKGETLKVKLDNITDSIDVGDVLVGHVRQIELPMVNAGSSTVEMRLLHTERPDVSLSPQGLFLAKAKSTFIVTVKYAPTSRDSSLTMTVDAGSAEETRPLFHLKARSVGFSLHLDRNALVFECIIIGKSHSLKVALINDGEIGTKYTWDFADVSDLISISPLTGYISAGARLVFEVKCTPIAFANSFGEKVFCRLEDADDLPLFISFSCVYRPSPTTWVILETKARQSVRKTIPITNSDTKDRHFQLDVEGEFFSGMDAITIPAGATVDYEITYTPLFMTGNLEHKGCLYVNYPHDRAGETYGLIGLASEPAPEGTIDWVVESRVQSSKEIILKNWLDSQQRFKVFVSSPNPGGCRPYQIECFQYCDLPPKGERIFTINFIAYKTNKYVFEVNFKNEDNGEYMLYYLFIEVKPGTAIREFSAETVVRKSVFINLPFSNPLSELKERIGFASFIEELTALNSPLIIPPESNAEMTIEFKPLVERRKYEKILIFKPNYVDEYKYKLILTALAADPEEPIKLSLCLGDFVEKLITISNMSLFDAVFSIKSDDNSIILTSSKVAVLSNGTSILRIKVEPMEIGTLSVNLTVSSDRAGTYVYPIHIKCDPPSPRGPFKLKPGHSLSIPFKNIFNYTVMFAISTTVFFESDSRLITIQPKNVYKIRVSMVRPDVLPDKNTIYTGNMTIKVVQDDFPPHKWTYYLSGIV